MGRSPIQIDWNEFDKLLSYQCTQLEIADFFSCSVDTLDRHCLKERGESFADIWNKKKSLGKIRLRKAQFHIVEKGGPGAATMAIYLDKKMFPNERFDLPPPLNVPISPHIGEEKKSFKEFCVTAGYPEPFDKQVEMMQFGITDGFPRILLGSRGYGKTDYITILGVAYALYLNPALTFMIVTKSASRNTAILAEIQSACEKNGMVFEKSNSTTLRVDGIHGKEDSVSAKTVKSKSFRGHHPFMVLMDDPVTEDDTSEATRKHVKKIYNELNKLTKNILIIGQPAHKFDLYAELRPRLEKLEVPYGSIPELDPDLEAQRLAGVDEASISASYYLKILSEGTIPFENIKYIDVMPVGGTSVAFLDPSDGGNNTALTIFKMIGQGMGIIGFQWRKGWNHCLDDMVPLLKKYGVSKICFETNKHGPQPLDVLRQVFTAAKLDVGVVGRNSNNNKHSRIMAAGIMAHMIHLSKESHKSYIDNVTQYEYAAKDDDAPDSLATGLEWLGMIKGKQ